MRKKKDARINREIRAPEIRLIGADGDQVGVVSVRDALAKAAALGLDLVEISPNTRPPVCRLMDYGKFKYIQKKKAQEAKKKQTTITVKEVKLRPQTDEHDIQYKLRNMRRFLGEGNKAKVTVVFRGREIAHTEKGADLMKRLLKEVEDIAQVEQQPRFEGRHLSMLLAPKPSVKGVTPKGT